MYIIDGKGQKILDKELAYYIGRTAIHIREIVNGKRGVLFDTAIKYEEKLRMNDVYIPAEFFMYADTKRNLSNYVIRLTDGLFDIRKFDPRTGDIIEINKIKEKDRKLYEEIRKRVLHRFSVNMFQVL